jgi:hypothetical protein
MTHDNDEAIGTRKLNFVAENLLRNSLQETVVKSVLLRIPLDTYSHLKRVQASRTIAEVEAGNSPTTPSLHTLILEAIKNLK